MIEISLQLIVSELDQALRLSSRGGSAIATLSDIVDASGAPVAGALDKVAAFVVSIEREDVPTRALRHVDTGQDRTIVRQPPVHLNLLVMFAANFSGSTYNEALKLIGGTIGFFQSRPVFNAQNTPALDPAIERLTMEIENLGTTGLSNLWGILGGRYVPSVLYRLRMITIDAQRVEALPPRVQRVAADAAARNVLERQSEPSRDHIPDTASVRHASAPAALSSLQV